MSVQREIEDIFLRVMNMNRQDILSACDNPGRGITNSTYVFHTTGGHFLLRVPGRGTEMICDRAFECALYDNMRVEHITDEVCYFDPSTGIRVTVYYPNCHVIDTANEDELAQAMALVRRFHGLHLQVGVPNTALQRLDYYMQCVQKVGGDAFYPSGFSAVRERVFHDCTPFYSEKNYQLVHGDCLPHNVLFPDGRGPILIDWEYAAVSDPVEDLGDFCHDGELDEGESIRLLRLYLQREPTAAECRKLFAMSASVALMWGAWSVFKAKMEPEDRAFYIDYAKLGVTYADASLHRMQKYI